MSRGSEGEGLRLVVLRRDPAQGGHAAAARLEAAGGAVVHRYGPRVMVAKVPRRAAKAIDALPEVRSMGVAAVDRPPAGATETEALGVAAWNLRQSRQFMAAKRARPRDGERWDAAAVGPQPPDGPGMTHTADDGAGILGLDDLSPYLIGSVALGLVIVDGPTPELTFSEDERTKVVAEVQEGLGWLATQDARASVTFSHDIRFVRVDATPDPARTGYEPLESLWRDPAMTALGHPTGLGGVRAYASRLRRDLGTRFAYVALFTKYPLQHFAYALKPRLVMHYDNDGWGPDNIDRVFVHETGHIFGCPDEYASASCSCTARAGYLREPNGNCQSCAPSPVDCIMLANTWAMCSHTPVHLGWRDSDDDGTLDPVDPIGNPLIDVGRICSAAPLLCQLLGLSPQTEPVVIPGRTTIGATTSSRASGGRSVPLMVLSRVLAPGELERVEAAARAEELAYLEAVERKLQAALRDLRRYRHTLDPGKL